MKHASTRLLLLVVGLLLHGLAVQAQIVPPLSASKARKPDPIQLSQLTLPVKASGLRHALPTAGGASAARLAQQPSLAGARAKQDVRSSETPAPARTSGSVSELWAARYATPDNSYDVATSTAVDTAGNVYVTGYSFADASSAISYDYVTIKYSADGQQQWQLRYDGAANGDDVATDLAVDTDGNVYVTGSSYNGTSYDYATVKYSPNGQYLWQASYNGPANSDDLAASVAVDAAGNVLVTGASYHGPSTGYDYVTLQYAASGAPLWQAHYSGSGASDELPTSIAVDGSGNVYVTGTSYTGSQSDYLTLKYAASGQQEWAARYNGPASGYDLVRDLAVDAAGNVAVTGTSDNGTSYDYATLKYAPDGQPVWQARYNGPGNSYDEATAVALDAIGNVAVTGYANTGNDNWDFVTIFYASVSGQPVWRRAYDGPDNGYDEATDVVVDTYNRVMITGRSYNRNGECDYLTTGYSIQYVGRQLPVARYNGPAGGDDGASVLAVDAMGNVIVTGTSFAGSRNFDYATVKYSPVGEQLWVARFEGIQTTGLPSQATDMAVDAAGNVVVTGYSRAGSGSRVYATVKYSASGQQIWEARYPPAFTGVNPVVGVDAAGNVYVAGTGAGDYVTIKYDGATGQQLWLRRYFAGIINRGNDVTDLAVDAAGNAYVTGRSVMGLITLYDYATIKYSPTGQELWINRYGPSIGAGANDVPSRVTLDAAGNVYVTGTSYSGVNLGNAYATIKYSAGGRELWVARYGTLAVGYNPTDIAVDAAGNVYVTGISTLKYSPSGQLLWTAPFFAIGAAIAVDAAGDVLVTGTGYLNADRSQGIWVTAKCDGASGQRLWQVFNGLGNPTDQAVAMALDGAGDVYVTGISSGSSTNYNTIKYAGASGQTLWETRDNSPSNADNRPVGLVVDGTGNVYVAGTSFASSSDSDYLTIKYTQASSVASASVVAASRAQLAAPAGMLQELAVYPNPAADQATVSFRPVLDGQGQVRVYNQLGQPVATLYEGAVRKGQRYTLPLKSQSLPAGLYECALLVNGQRQTVRLLVAH
ncbi:SBBP repeat-containing protein [uncultured Hymenobacter sp.]|uniref:SBBP repeat-containing protein n=1 Tax=uncultured Hymenobacter sp. TaxID=170016 RepID=UPI0035CA90A7